MESTDNFSTFADIIGVKHGVWTRCKALRLVKDKGTDAFSAYRSAITVIAMNWTIFFNSEMKCQKKYVYLRT